VSRPTQQSSVVYSALVFDVGNTLVRTADSVESAYLRVFARHGIPAEKIRLFKQFAGRPKHFLFSEALGDIPGKAGVVRACMAEFEKILAEEVGHIAELPGASDCLRRLRSHGWRIAMASGFPRVVGRAILDRFGWDYPLVCDEDVEEHRPAPDPVLKACALLAVKPAEAVVVGDTPQDVLSAKAAGACSIAVTTGKFTDEELAGYRPAFIISGLAELPDLLEREFSGPPPP